MEINKKGTVFEYNGIPYVIGETVVGTEVTPYEGLLGEIIAITQENGEENSEKPIFCCTFPPPDSPHDREMIEKRFSKWCGVPKSMEEIPLSMVLLSPEAVMPVAFLESSRKKYQVTMLYEDWQSTESMDNLQSFSAAFTTRSLHSGWLLQKNANPDMSVLFADAKNTGMYREKIFSSVGLMTRMAKIITAFL